VLDEDHRFFDNQFFGISPKEAESMDPQQRILLETVYESIETAGYSIQQLRGTSTAVFVGMMNSDYTHILFSDPENLPSYTASGIALSIMANRVSYFFDWTGPSVVIDTACSSSMVALHQAVQALRNGEAKMAVVAGTNLILGPEMFIAESKVCSMRLCIINADSSRLINLG
jgi:acyl transferase domain-containing protein